MSAYLPVPEKLLTTRVRIMARTATVIINGIQSLAIGLNAWIVLLSTDEALDVMPDVAPNLPNVSTPTPKIIPLKTSSKIN